MKFVYGLAASFLVIVATAALALGQTPKKMSQEDVAGTVSVMDHIWLNAAHNRDTGTMAWLFADNFVEIHPGGEIVNKAQQIDQIKDTQPGKSGTPSGRHQSALHLARMLPSCWTPPRFEASAGA